MKRPAQLLRLFYINYVIARHGLDRLVLSTPLFSSIRFLSYLNPWNWRRSKERTRGESVRLALGNLGPIFVKFGQILSTRYDLLPDDIINELQKLQDQVPPFEPGIVQEIIERSYGPQWNTIFTEFSFTPFASASIAQVHAATLANGHQVVVKIRRPHIEETIQRDLGLLYTIAGLGERFWAHGRRLHLRDLVSEFEQTITGELDLMSEAANASQLRRNFLDSDLLYIPKIYWEYSSQSVMVMERISGISIWNVAALKEEGVNLKKLAEKGVEIFFTQVLRDNFFHADMHPGNIFVAKDHPENPKYIAVDFGIVGSLSPSDQLYLAENLLAFFNRDYRRVAMLHVESGWVPPQTRIEAFEAVIRSDCEPIFEKPLKDISFAQILLRLFQTAGRFNMEVQPQLFLLQKTLLHVESIGRQLYPELNLWLTAKPFLERWVKQQYNVKTTLKNLMHQSPYLIEKLIALPSLLHDVLQQEKKTQAVNMWKSKSSTKKNSKASFKYFFLGVGLATFLILLANIVFFH